MGKQTTLTSQFSALPDEIRVAQRKLEQQRLDLGIVPPEVEALPSIPVLQPPPIETLSGNWDSTPSKETAKPSSAPGPRLSSRKAEKVLLIREMEAENRWDIGTIVRPLVRCQLPMTDPKFLDNPKCYERTDGDRTTRLVATSDRDLPYGGDIVTLYGLCTKGREMYKSLGREWDGVVSFSSTAEMLRYFGDPPTKYYYDLRMQSLMRIWHCRLEIIDTLRRLAHKGPVQKKFVPLTFLGPVTLWFQLEGRQLGMPFTNVIQFSPEMIHEIKQAPLYEDQKVFWLKKSVGALQLYLFLRDRCAQADLKDKPHAWIPVHGPNSLETQLGWVRLPKPQKVRWQISNWLALLKTSVWPTCPGELCLGNDNNWRLKIWYVPPASRR